MSVESTSYPELDNRRQEGGDWSWWQVKWEGLCVEARLLFEIEKRAICIDVGDAHLVLLCLVYTGQDHDIVNSIEKIKEKYASGLVSLEKPEIIRRIEDVQYLVYLFTEDERDIRRKYSDNSELLFLLSANACQDKERAFTLGKLERLKGLDFTSGCKVGFLSG